MDSQQQQQQQQSWQANPAGSVSRHGSIAAASQQQPPKYDPYNMARPSSQTNPQEGDNDGDRVMEDADPYNRQKYSSSSRTPTQRNAYLSSQPNMDSTAARRYSPMNTTSPTSPYVSSPNQYTPQMRQSPTRHMYSSPTQSRPNLPPIQSNADFYPSPFNQSGLQSPRLPPPNQSHSDPQTRGPVPVFTKCDNVGDLQPRVNAQPPFRRAHPDGGFISPLQALTTQLPATYRICNPNFQYESSRNPRRVLTKPSKGTKNDGYDNEDSDYILYVND
ncbi:kinase-like protein, partial [Aureobasidium melanogenum]